MGKTKMRQQNYEPYIATLFLSNVMKEYDFENLGSDIFF